MKAIIQTARAKLSRPVVRISNSKLQLNYPSFFRNSKTLLYPGGIYSEENTGRGPREN
jgi:hypothetical protein